ncbi:type II toxin-antitoxin system PemK/MazF family toxin [Trueperella sp. LYQ143]|uniref:type II toxin-antitoxin system PemK/MazF family toxin n=1 Tax=unclassified Trueperella TaxID=2630174 RepID=UPI0039835607
MALSDFLQRTVRSVARAVGRDLSRQLRRSAGASAPASRSSSRRSSTSSSPEHPHHPGPGKSSNHTSGHIPNANEPATEYDVETFGLPTFRYSPADNGMPDPGEVVWTWVPFEEHDGRGKDRPVLVLAHRDRHIIFIQMTSQDNTRDAAHEAHWGRYWMDVGSGDWDPKGRPSEVRLDRLLIAHESVIRREGSFLDRAIYDKVCQAVREIHRR